MRRLWVVGGAVVLAVALTAGCARSKPRTYDAGRSMAALTAGGWTASRAAGRPDTAAGVRQVDYLETTAPDARRIDLQFFENPAAARRELDTEKLRTKGFAGTAVGNVLVVGVPDANRAVPGVDLTSLRSLLRT